MASPLMLGLFVMLCGVAYSGGCIQYPTTPKSSHNNWNKLVVYPRMHKDMVITDIHIVRRDFYRCEMTKNGELIMFYGTNGTHYWVERGCGGDFLITECTDTDALVRGPGGYTRFSPSHLLKQFDNALEFLKNEWQRLAVP